jgi:hypothetical protein
MANHRPNDLQAAARVIASAAKEIGIAGPEQQRAGAVPTPLREAA